MEGHKPLSRRFSGNLPVMFIIIKTLFAEKRRGSVFISLQLRYLDVRTTESILTAYYVGICIIMGLSFENTSCSPKLYLSQIVSPRAAKETNDDHRKQKVAKDRYHS